MNIEPLTIGVIRGSSCIFCSPDSCGGAGVMILCGVVTVAGSRCRSFTIEASVHGLSGAAPIVSLAPCTTALSEDVGERVGDDSWMLLSVMSVSTGGAGIELGDVLTTFFWPQL